MSNRDVNDWAEPGADLPGVPEDEAAEVAPARRRPRLAVIGATSAAAALVGAVAFGALSSASDDVGPGQPGASQVETGDPAELVGFDQHPAAGQPLPPPDDDDFESDDFEDDFGHHEDGDHGFGDDGPEDDD